MTRRGSGVQVPHGALQKSLETGGSCFGQVRHFCVLRPLGSQTGSQRDLFRFPSGRAAFTATAATKPVPIRAALISALFASGPHRTVLYRSHQCLLHLIWRNGVQMIWKKMMTIATQLTKNAAVRRYGTPAMCTIA
jgi:hypothetical protein